MTDLNTLQQEIESVGNQIRDLKANGGGGDALGLLITQLNTLKKQYAEQNGGLGFDGKPYQPPALSKAEKKKLEKEKKAAAAAASGGGGGGTGAGEVRVDLRTIMNVSFDDVGQHVNAVLTTAACLTCLYFPLDGSCWCSDSQSSKGDQEGGKKGSQEWRWRSISPFSGQQGSRQWWTPSILLDVVVLFSSGTPSNGHKSQYAHSGTSHGSLDDGDLDQY
jgi:hypothetical protein